MTLLSPMREIFLMSQKGLRPCPLCKLSRGSEESIVFGVGRCRERL